MMKDGYKKFKPFGWEKVPFLPEFGRFLPTNPFAYLELRRMVVVEVFDDVIECNFENDESETSIYVAKPYSLRVRDLYDAIPDNVRINGIDYKYVSATERTAIDPDGIMSDENQIITPDYYAGEIIDAMYWQAGFIDSEFNVNMIYLDMNTAGRSWCVKVVT